MNKTELIAQVAEKTGLSKKDSELAVNASLETITETLIQGEKVQLVGFGVDPGSVGQEEDWHGGSRRQRSERG